jgi:hypothetical protein
MVGSVSFADLHPDTEPEAIAAAQRDAVFEAHRNATPEEISDRVDLPVWTVRRRLAELGLGPPVENAKKKVFAERSLKHRAKTRIMALLQGKRAMSCHEIARRLSMDPAYVQRIVVTASEILPRGKGGRREKGGAVQLWSLANK